MKRGEIWTVAGGGDYTGKPRPAVIIQDDHFIDTDSVTICAGSCDSTDAPLFRIAVRADDRNGLDADSRIMADKITTVRRSRLAARLGHLDGEEMVKLERAMVLFLGLAAPRPRMRRR